MADARPPLPTRAKVLYASSSLGGEALSQARNLWLIFFYAPPSDEPDLTTFISRLTLGVVLTVGRVIESLDDPVIGWLSDRTRSRWGRRIPYVVLFSPPWAILYVLLWTPPVEGESALNVLYLFLVFEAFYLFSTLSGGPLESLMPEIARTSRDRVGVMSWKTLFALGGAGLGLVLSGPLIDLLGYRGMAVVLAALALMVRAASVYGASPHIRRDQPPARIPFWRAVRETFRNREFLAFLPTYVFFQLGFVMVVALIPFYVDVILERGQAFTGVLTGAALGTVLATLPLYTRLARRWGKPRTFSRSMLAASLLFPTLAVAGFVPGVPELVQALVWVPVVSLPLAGVFLLPSALTADIVDYDETLTGMRREATYFGTQNFVEKTTSSFAPLIFAGLLTLGETTADPLGIRLVGPAAGLSVFIGWFLFRGYTLPDEVPVAERRAA